MTGRLLLAAVLGAVAVGLLGSGWLWAARRYRARRMVRQLRATSPNPAMPLPDDRAVAAAGDLHLPAAQRAEQERALEAMLALPWRP